MQRKTLKECIQNFGPAWFTVIMGTGSVSVLLSKFHFGAGSLILEVLSLIFFFLNLALFVLFCGMTIARYWLFPGMWSTMLLHPEQGLFISAFPMGAATLINSALIANREWGFSGTRFLYALWALWWADFLISCLSAFGTLFVMITIQRHSFLRATPIWAMPVLSLVVTSGTGASLAQALHHHSIHHALITTTASMIVLLIGLSTFLMVLTVYFFRLVIHGLPDVPLILSAFVPLGPFGQGGFSLLILGQNLSVLLPLNSGDMFPSASFTGQLLYSACFCGAWTFWSMGLGWAVISFFSIFTVSRRHHIPFSLSYWSLIFPNGVFALLSVELGVILSSPFFHYFGAIWSGESIITVCNVFGLEKVDERAFEVFVFSLWLVEFAMTLPMVWNTTIFVLPRPSLPLVEFESKESYTPNFSRDSLHPIRAIL